MSTSNQLFSSRKSEETSMKSDRSTLPSQLMEPIRAELYFTSSKNGDEILDIFEETANRMSFSMLESEKTYATAVQRKKKQSSSFGLLNCFAWFDRKSCTVIKISINFDESKKQNLCFVRGLIGNVNTIDEFVTYFKKTMNLSQEQLQHFIIKEVEDISDPFSMEAYSTLFIGTLLAKKEDPLGKLCSDLFSDYASSFNNIAESVSSIPLPMKNTKGIAHELFEALQKEKRDTTVTMQPYYFLAVEKYVFDRLQSTLYGIYNMKNMEVNTSFKDKVNKIFESMNLRGVLNEVGLDVKFWSVKSPELLEKQLPKREMREALTFAALACSEFEKIVFTNNPREKIKYCEMMYSGLKTHFYEFSNKKHELSSMEDIIPIMILIVMLCDIGCLRTELDVMNDFISLDAFQLQAQKRLILNISESYNYVVRDWKLS